MDDSELTPEEKELLERAGSAQSSGAGIGSAIGGVVGGLAGAATGLFTAGSTTIPGAMAGAGLGSSVGGAIGNWIGGAVASDANKKAAELKAKREKDLIEQSSEYDEFVEKFGPWIKTKGLL